MVGTDEAAIRSVLDRFCRGWEHGDADAVLGCFLEDEATTVIGTDANEYWRGHAAFAEPFRAMATAFTDARYRWQADPGVTLAGQTAWADAVLDTRLVTGGQTVSATMRTSWVLRRGPDGWKVVQAHFSVAAADAVAAY